MAKALHVERVGLFFEGFEIDYPHVKTVPVSTEISATENSIEDNVGAFYATYSGYLPTQTGPERDVLDVKGRLHLKIGKIKAWSGG